MSFLIPVLTMTILGLLFSAGLVVAYKKLKVEEDPKIEAVNEALPQANCGACGFSGCRAFAEAVVKGKADSNGCPVGGNDVAAEVAKILGVSAGTVFKRVARLHCRGTKDAAASRGIYLGVTTCAASHLIGGNKQCSYGCMGYGDCVLSCQFDAMEMGEDGLPIIIEENCTACGKCVEACPRNLIELLPLEQNIFVYCRSLDGPKASRKLCKNACIACGICARACPEQIIMENNLAVIIDYKKIDQEKIPAIEKCPTNAIGRLKIEEIDRKKEEEVARDEG
ncbi:RnfABCDGE type electron transport complex subunit B [Acidobacteriota bacterium]